ncbi:MAG: DUF1156 domain-containing protein [Candidatus Riflebacteria bacterium]|nr:DUF1156 domain-containing protein [Candidatus Riflebacteria bacterium]
MLKPFEWKDRPSLIEHLFPVQKISAESFKEQMANTGKALTALGSYWKGRKPLVLNKACILGALLPATNNRIKDLEIFELLMGMDSQTMQKRLEANMPVSKHYTLGEYLILPFNEQIKKAKRPEELEVSLFEHIWEKVNKHLGTEASSFPELVEQMGIARFGHRPKVADVFCGSGQIPFEAARLGCDVYASDLNPIACMLTWGAFNIVGANEEMRAKIDKSQKEIVELVESDIDELKIEKDENEWKAKFYLYCVEILCPETGWRVPLLPNRIISKDWKTVFDIIPDRNGKNYKINIRQLKEKETLEGFEVGTYCKGEVFHTPDGENTKRFKISTLRGDYKDGKENKNRLRLWGKSDFVPWPNDVFQERLYCIQWLRKKTSGKGDEFQFRSVTADDQIREQKVIEYVGAHLSEWQEKGYVPDMLIEAGEKTDEPIRTRGWTHWHHLFNPRQLLWGALCLKYISGYTSLAVLQTLNRNAKLSRWDYSQIGGGGSVKDVFYNQALNTLFDYGCRASESAKVFLMKKVLSHPIQTMTTVNSHPAQELATDNDIYVTDPPYGDAVKYEEITEFFIAWLRKNPPPEFANWIWDSRRSLAIKGEGEGFRSGMIAAYRQMAKHMPDNGIQVLMFTHQSGSIWADMTNIIWASGLQVTAAWYVVTETDSALRQGANVTGTVMLVLRKRTKQLETFRDDLGWEIEAAVKQQVESLIGLDKTVREQRSEGLYTDADLQMAGYAAALKVLTAYSKIDGKDMVTESEAPRIPGRKTFVEELINFAVQTAVQFLVPAGFDKSEWQKLAPVERFYLKMAEMESQGIKTLDNYQNFAKAFKVHHFDQLMSDASKANAARLKLSTEFKSALMSGEAEIASTPLRALLYAMCEVAKEIEVDDVLLHLMQNCVNFLQMKPLIIKMADYLAEKRGSLKPTKTFRPDLEASAARILTEALRNQRV